METIKYFHQPTISESLGNGWLVMKKYFLLLLLVVIINGIVQGIAKFDYKFDDPAKLIPFAPLIGFAILVGLAMFFMVQPIIRYGAKQLFLNAVRDVELDLKVLFIGFQRNYINIVLANLIVVLIVGVGLIFLIIPGIIFACRLSFVPYLVMDKGLEAVKAVETSWKMTKGYGWRIFGLLCMSFLIVIAGLICLIIGVFPAAIWIGSTWASFYQAVETKLQNDEPYQMAN